MSDSTSFDWVRVVLVIATGIAAALGVQAAPAAKPDDVRGVVREEVAPLRVAIENVTYQQQAQAARLLNVEQRLTLPAALPASASPVTR